MGHHFTRPWTLTGALFLESDIDMAVSQLSSISIAIDTQVILHTGEYPARARLSDLLHFDERARYVRQSTAEIGMNPDVRMPDRDQNSSSYELQLV